MGFKIKELREKENLSQAELAQKSGVSQNLIARLESGALTNTTTDTLFKISKAFSRTCFQSGIAKPPLMCSKPKSFGCCARILKRKWTLKRMVL